MTGLSATDTKNIIVVSDNTNTVDQITDMTANREWQLFTLSTGSLVKTETLPDEIDLAILNTSCEQLRDCLRPLRDRYPRLEIIFMPEDYEHLDLLPVQQLRLFDIIEPTLHRAQFLLKIESAFRLTQSAKALQNIKQQIAMNYGFDNIVGESKPMRKVIETVKRIAPTDITVMLTGQNGVGKNLTARVIHHHSERRKQPIVVVECASIPEYLFETELFGTRDESGRFQGGLLQKADRGSLYFNDVDKLPLSIQPKVLDMILQKSIQEEQPARKYDVRILSATANDINGLVERHLFIEGLYYQLAVMPIHLPALAKRLEDVEQLAMYFCRKAAFEMNKEYINISAAALEMLIAYPWPGNVRELENTMKRAAALAYDNMIEPEHIVFIHKQEPQIPVKQKLTIDDQNGERLEEGQRKLILKALHQNDWNFTHTANELGIGRTTLWRKVKKYNLQKEPV